MTHSNKNHPQFQWRMAQTPRRTLQELAIAVGCSQPYLSAIENRKKEPSLELAARLHRETGLPMTAFLKQPEATQ